MAWDDTAAGQPGASDRGAGLRERRVLGPVSWGFGGLVCCLCGHHSSVLVGPALARVEAFEPVVELVAVEEEGLAAALFAEGARPGYAHAPAKPGRGRRSDACLDNKIVEVFVWLFQKLFHTRPCWTKCNPREVKSSPFAAYS